MILRKFNRWISGFMFMILSYLLVSFGWGVGISEPGVQIWGKVRNQDVLITEGKLKLTLTCMEGGDPIQVETRLGSFKDAQGDIYSYKTYFPLETDLADNGITHGCLELPFSFEICYQGSLEYNLETIELPYGYEIITITPDSRGRTIRLDFNIGDSPLGDANTDGVFELQDSLFVLQCYLEGATPDQMNEKQRSLTDANCDGVITPRDAQWIFEGFEGSRILEFCENPSPNPENPGSECFLIAGNTLGAQGFPVIVPISALNAPETSSYGLLMHYNGAMLDLGGVMQSGTASEDWFGLGAYERAPGVVAIGGFRGLAPSFSGDDLVVNVQLYVKPEAIGDIPIILSDLVDDFTGATTIPGNVRVSVNLDTSLWILY